ncbi:MAG TPA: HAMP domain-containing sensor histidine kinase, partial [Candidatus Dormibacteraeota bacterium]|nr:HAMP domain-containing sensor histidine kinase [Candidatus Dormibacteraeota bacterium]
HLSIASSPMVGDGDVVTGISLVLTDVTERVRAKVAQRESEAKSRLMAMMNHEVRTPLNSILGFARLLQDPQFGQLNEKQHRYVSNIESSGNHLLELVNQSLDLATLDAKSSRIELEDVCVETVMTHAAEQIRPLAESNGLTLSVLPVSDLFAVADRRLLVQVLLNLLSNAIRHTHPGGSVTLSSQRTGAEVLISVADTGDGISTEDQRRLFEEFFQASNHAPGGIGLGLAISRRLVQMLGGSISVESDLGHGSVFRIQLRSPRHTS